MLVKIEKDHCHHTFEFATKLVNTPLLYKKAEHGYVSVISYCASHLLSVHNMS